MTTLIIRARRLIGRRNQKHPADFVEARVARADATPGRAVRQKIDWVVEA
jgi:hypothetical protein